VRLHGQNRSALEPRLWARYTLGEQSALKGSVGLYTQPPTVEQLEPVPFGNPKLGYERAFQSSLGVEHRFTDVVNLDVTGFYNRRYELVVAPGQTEPQPDGTVIRQRFGNEGLGKAYGVEVMLRHELSRRFFGWVAYTLSRSVDRRENEVPYRLTPFDQTHILTAVGSWRLPWDLELGGRFRYVTGGPTTPIAHPYDAFDIDANRFVGQPGGLFSARLRPFHQLDLRLEKSFLFTSWTLGLYIDVQNVYNAKNVEATFYDYRFRQRLELQGIPILPMLGIRGSF
jgi:hypothetical protein